MSMKEVKEMTKLCKIIGLETIGDVNYFQNREQMEGETLLQALRRYAKELEEQV